MPTHDGQGRATVWALHSTTYTHPLPPTSDPFAQTRLTRRFKCALNLLLPPLQSVCLRVCVCTIACRHPHPPRVRARVCSVVWRVCVFLFLYCVAIHIYMDVCGARLAGGLAGGCVRGRRCVNVQCAVLMECFQQPVVGGMWGALCLSGVMFDCVLAVANESGLCVCVPYTHTPRATSLKYYTVTCV